MEADAQKDPVALPDAHTEALRDMMAVAETEADGESLRDSAPVALADVDTDMLRVTVAVADAQLERESVTEEQPL
jgi:hypothetical protein